MARYKGHITAAVFVWCIISLFLLSSKRSFLLLVSWLFWSCFGALFPDIDTKSKGQKLFYFILIPVFLFFFLKGWLIMSLGLTIFAMLPLIVNHRGIFHSFWFLLLVPTLLACLCSTYYPCLHADIMIALLFFCVGALSHLWLDFGIKRMFFR